MDDQPPAPLPEETSDSPPGGGVDQPADLPPGDAASAEEMPSGDVAMAEGDLPATEAPSGDVPVAEGAPPGPPAAGPPAEPGGAGRRSWMLGVVVLAVIGLLALWWLGGRGRESGATPTAAATAIVLTAKPIEPTLEATVAPTRAATLAPTVATPGAPQARISGPTTGTVGQPVTFSAEGSTAEGGIDSYRWDLGDGDRATGPTVVHSYDLAGTFTVFLVITDTAGQAATARHVVAIQAAAQTPPSAVISGPSAAQVGETVTFDASASTAGSSAISTYAWSFGDGSQGSGRVVSHAYGKAGTYYVLLTVTDANGLTDSASHELRVSAPTPPKAVIKAPSQAKVGQKVTFDGSSSTSGSPIVAYVWSFGDGGSASSVVATYAYNKPGSYDVTLAVIDQTGAQSTARHQIAIEAEPAEPPTALLAGPSTAVVGEAASYDATGSRPASSPIVGYEWTVNGARISAAAGSPVLRYTFSTPGEFTVAVLVTDQNGASDSATVQTKVSANLDSLVWYLDGADPPITLTASGGTAAGSAGCNTYMASYTASGSATEGQVTVGTMTTSRRACPEPAMTQEQEYLATLQTVTTYRIDGDQLELAGSGGTLTYMAR